MQAGKALGVTPARALEDQAAKKVPGRRAIGRSERGKLRLAKGKGKGTALGQLDGVREQLRIMAQQLLHLARGPEMELARQLFGGVLLAEQRERANRLHDVKLPTVPRHRVMNRKGDERRRQRAAPLEIGGASGREIEAPGKEIGQARIGADRQQPPGASVELAEREDSIAAREPPLFGAGAVGVFPTSAGREKAAEIAVAGQRFGIELEGAVGQLDLRAEDRFDASLARGLHERHGPVEIPLVGQRDSRQVVRFGQTNDGLDGQSGIEKRIITAHVQGDVTSVEAARDRRTEAGSGPRRGTALRRARASGKLPQLEVVPAQDDLRPARAAQLIDDHRQPPLGGHLFRVSFQRQLDPK